MALSLQSLGYSLWVGLSKDSCRLALFFNNPVNFDSIFLLFNTFFNFEMTDLLCVKALSMMLLHTTISMDMLYETNHRLVALGVKVDVVASSNAVEASSTVLQWIVTYRVFDIISEIANKPLSIA